MEKNLKKIAKYIVVFAVFLLLSVKTKSGLSPFAVGMFAALVYSGFNLFALAPIYVASALLADPTLGSLITAAFVPCIMGFAYFVHFLCKKPVRLIHVNIYAFLCQIPATVLYYNSGYSSPVNVLLAQIFAYCSIIAVHAVTSRGLRYRMTVDEMISTAVVLAALSLGVFDLEFAGFKPFYGAAAFLILCAVFVFGNGAVVIAAVMGLGAGLKTGTFDICALLTVWAVMAVAFRSLPKYCPAIALFIADVVMGAYYNVFVYDLYHTVSVIIGAGLFCLVRDSYLVGIAHRFDMVKGRAEKALVLRNRREMALKLSEVGNVFCEMEKVLLDGVRTGAGEKMQEEICGELSKRLCDSCSSRSKCLKLFGGRTETVFDSLVETSLKLKRVSFLDLTPYITGNCVQVNKLMSILGDLVDRSVSYKAQTEKKLENRLLMSEQMSGVAKIINDLANRISGGISFEQGLERELCDELTVRNVICSDAIVYADGGEMKVSLVIRTSDKDKRTLGKVVSKVVGMKMVLDSCRIQDKDWCVADFVAEPKYDMVFGEASVKKNSSDRNGDSQGVIYVKGKYVMAICDGMGSGEDAERSSSSAIGMIESMYRAGFNHDLVLETVNKLLSGRDEETYSAVDMAVIDMKCGSLDIIKLGACEGVIRRRESVEIIEGNALPIGIIGDAGMKVVSKTVDENDTVVLFSDGVADALGVDFIADYVEKNDVTNPQKLANVILETARRSENAADDMTVLAGRMFRRV